MRKDVPRFHVAAIIICLLALVTACAPTTAEPDRVYDPGEVSTSCAENLGLPGAVIMSLAAAFRDSDGKITDSFREKASRDIAESEGVPPSDSDAIFRQYISCLESSIAQ